MTPQPIKDAAEKMFAEENPTAFVSRQLFIAGATHPDTEKYYRERFENEIQGLIEYIEENGVFKFYLIKGTELHAAVKKLSDNGDVKFTDLLHLYREQLTNKNTGDEK